MTAGELMEQLNEKLNNGQIEKNTSVVYGVQSQALDIETVKVVDMAIRDSFGKAKTHIRRVLLT